MESRKERPQQLLTFARSAFCLAALSALAPEANAEKFDRFFNENILLKGEPVCFSGLDVDHDGIVDVAAPKEEELRDTHGLFLSIHDLENQPLEESSDLIAGSRETAEVLESGKYLSNASLRNFFQKDWVKFNNPDASRPNTTIVNIRPLQARLDQINAGLHKTKGVLMPDFCSVQEDEDIIFQIETR
jgi:hypothetical protein